MKLHIWAFGLLTLLAAPVVAHDRDDARGRDEDRRGRSSRDEGSDDRRGRNRGRDGETVDRPSSHDSNRGQGRGRGEGRGRGRGRSHDELRAN